MQLITMPHALTRPRFDAPIPPSPLALAVAEVRAQRQRLPRMAPFRKPVLVQRRYEKQLKAIAASWTREVERGMAPLLADYDAALAVRADSAERFDDGFWSSIFDGIRAFFGGLRFTLFDEDRAAKAVGSAGRGTERQNREALNRQFRSVLGIDPVGREGLGDILTSFERTNLSLIKTLSVEQTVKLEGRILKAVRKGENRKALEDEINLFGQASKRRVKVIVRDQVGKLTGQLRTVRNQRLGIRSFIWRTSRDERVVGNPAGLYPGDGSPLHGNHWEREGRQFLYELNGGRLVEVLKDGSEVVTNYTDGLPGQPILDRCTDFPVIPGLEDLQSIEEVIPIAHSPLVKRKRR